MIAATGFRSFWIFLCCSYLVDLTNSVSEQISVYVPPPTRAESSSSSSSSYPSQYAFDLHEQESQNYPYAVDMADDELVPVVPIESDDYILRYEDDDVGSEQGPPLPLPVADFDDGEFYSVFEEEFPVYDGNDRNKGEVATLNNLRRRRRGPYDHWMGSDNDDLNLDHDDDNGWDDSDYPYGYGGYNKDFGKYKGKKYVSRRKNWDYSNYNQYPHYKYANHPLDKYGDGSSSYSLSHSFPKIKHEYHKYDEEDDYLHPLDKYSNSEYPYPKASAGLSAKYHFLKHKIAVKNHHHYGW